ncbi:MAG: hypothetical protein FD126_1444 [Elusimicrobia bacterium]|nr:MAG: hypothetical protein FD126_1444 [Elusimicrobiota bacterium]
MMGLLTRAAAAGGKRYVPDQGLVDWGADLEVKEEFRFPFAAKYDDGTKRLTYVAGNHTAGMGPNLKTVKAIFDDLKPQAVLVEGFRTKGDFSYREYDVEDFAADGFKTASEAGFAVWLAAGKKLPARGGEPEDAGTLAHVVKLGFTARDLLGFFVVRMVPSWRRDGEVPDESGFRAKAVENIERDRRKLRIKARFGYDDLLRWYSAQGAEVPIREARYQDMGPESGADATRLQKLAFAVDQARQARFQKQLENLLNRFDRLRRLPPVPRTPDARGPAGLIHGRPAFPPRRQLNLLQDVLPFLSGPPGA